MFDSWVEEVKSLLENYYGIEVGDCTDDEQMRHAFDNGESADEFVCYVGEKFDLVPIG